MICTAPGKESFKSMDHAVRVPPLASYNKWLEIQIHSSSWAHRPTPTSLDMGAGTLRKTCPNHSQTMPRDELSVSMTQWISMSKALDTWVSHNTATGKFHFNGNINQDIRDHLSGANGKAAAESFPFRIATMPRPTSEKNGAEVKDFDAGLTGMLFGKGKTSHSHVPGRLPADVDDDEVTSEDHPLYKVLVEYSDGWCVERGSTLCFYDSRYFFLKFRRPGESLVKMHWNLPPNMNAKLAELREVAEQPEEQIALNQEEQTWKQVAKMRMITEIGANSMLMHQYRRTVRYYERGVLLGEGLAAAATANPSDPSSSPSSTPLISIGRPPLLCCYLVPSIDLGLCVTLPATSANRLDLHDHHNALTTSSLRATPPTRRGAALSWTGPP
ncbi:hypothetical protein B0H14DRAFT_3752674 [Mycena olivaceomarginata]|nr:hypothetical protein B0H14DRAFT_3752674 [Mycena olivaceomarginata]